MTQLRWRSVDVVLVVLLLAAAGCRLFLAADVPYVHDEENNAIPLARSISVTPGAVHLPLRGENHGALPAYVARASSALFGTSPLGYRTLHAMLGVGAVLLVYLVGRQWYGVAGGRWAAALLAFNDYFLPISSRVTAHAPFLFLVALAVYAFSRFLATERPLYLYGAGCAAGLGFYCKEHAVLLLPAFFLTLLVHPGVRRWVRSPQPYLAAAVFALFLAPDLYWNATAVAPGVNYGDQVAMQAKYGNHLSRIGGVGFSPYPLMFYARSAVQPAYQRVTGRELVDETAEYSSINPWLGVVLLAGVLLASFTGRTSAGAVFLVLMFWCVFGLFTLIERGNPPGRLDPVSWIWVEASMFPAVLLTGGQLAALRGWSRTLSWVVAGCALVYAVAQVVTQAVA